MANLYVSSLGTNTAPYDTWVKAATAPGTAISAAAAGDTIYIDDTAAYTISANTTYTFTGTVANPTKLIASHDLINAPPQTLGSAVIDGSGTSAVSITYQGKAFIYGVEFKSGGSTGAGSHNLVNNDDAFMFCENCKFTIPNTSASSLIQIGASGSSQNNGLITKNCTFTTGNAAGQGIQVAGTRWESIGDTFKKTTTAVTTLFKDINRSPDVVITGADMTDVTGTLLAGTVLTPATLRISNSKLGSGMTPLGTSAGQAHGEVYFYNCNSGAVNYNFAHYSYLGNTTTVTSPSSDTGALYDGTNHWTLKITGTNATIATPYYSPWFEKYVSDTSTSITPWLEIERDDSSTAFTDVQCWANFSYQSSASWPIASFNSSRNAGWWYTSANIPAGAGLSAWTGESGTAWSGKLVSPAAFTPAAIGPLRARVAVSAAITVYVDAKIRT